MHALVNEALNAVVLKQDGALSAIADADLERLCAHFAASNEITAHLEALVAAHRLYKRGLKIAAKQLVRLAEKGLPLAERRGDRLGKALRRAASTINASDKAPITLKRPVSSGAGLRQRNRN